MSINSFPQAPFAATGPHFVSPERLSVLPGEWRYPCELAKHLVATAPTRAIAEGWEFLRQQGYRFIPGPPRPASLHDLMERFPSQFAGSLEQVRHLSNLLLPQASTRAMTIGPGWVIMRSQTTTSTVKQHFGNAKSLRHNFVRPARAAEVIWGAVVMRLLGYHDFLRDEATFTSDVVGDGRHLIVHNGSAGISLRTTSIREHDPDVGVLLVHDAMIETLRLTA